MYKEIIICIVVIASIITINWLLQDYTKKSTTEINDNLEELKQDLKESDKEKIESKIEEIKSNWSEQYGILAAFIEHDELEKVETDLVTLEGYIEVGDYEKGINEINKSIFSLKHISEKYDFSFINVF